MVKFVIATGIAWLFATLYTATLASAEQAIGFRQWVIEDAAGARPLQVTAWYPTSTQGDPIRVGDNPAFEGISVIPEASPADGRRPLVVLSHGYGGSWRNLSWLAADLVRQGYLVAAPDHPGTTTFDRNPVLAEQLWDRPRDLSRVIDALLADPGLAGAVDEARIAAVGHSLGGWTVTALAGARFDRLQFAADCQTGASPRACSLRGELGLDRAEIEQDLGDPRLAAFATLDLGLARGFAAESVAAMQLPGLVIGAGVDSVDLPAELESGYLAQHLPKALARHVEIPDATHFSFMQLCRPGARALIESETPGDGIVCDDGGSRPRSAIHDEISSLVQAFLARTMPDKSLSRSLPAPAPSDDSHSGSGR